MKSAKIYLPEKLELDKMFPFALEIDRHNGSEKIEIFVGKNRWFPPFAQLFLGLKLKSLRLQNPIAKIGIIPDQSIEHLENVGFYDLISEKEVRTDLSTFGTTTIPITKLTRTEVVSMGSTKGIEMGDAIQEHADIIAEMISRDFQHKKEVCDVLSYSIREIMRNTFEHSEANELYYCAQFWPSKGKVEVSIADLGSGIRSALRENPNFRYPTDKQAIEMSLMPGVSGKTHKPRKSTTWFNSGYGLYMTNRLARNGGNFVITSGKSGIRISKDYDKKANYQTSFPGTALRLNFDVGLIGDLSTRLEGFRKDARVIEKEILGNAGRPPSGISLTLRRDFK